MHGTSSSLRGSVSGKDVFEVSSFMEREFKSESQREQNIKCCPWFMNVARNHRQKLLNNYVTLAPSALSHLLILKRKFGLQLVKMLENNLFLANFADFFLKHGRIDHSFLLIEHWYVSSRSVDNHIFLLVFCCITSPGTRDILTCRLAVVNC